jgi:acyl-CoA thioesterase I
MLFALLASGCGNSTPAQSPPSAGDSAVPSPAPNATADDRPIILAFGDSLTAGFGVPPGSGYPERLQKELDGQGYAYRVVNAGVGGDTTGGGLARLRRALDLNPEIVILELGGNDGLRGIPIDVMQSNLQELIVAFKKGGAKVVLGGMTLPRNFGPDYISAFEKIYPALAAKNSVALIPFFLEGAAGNPDLMQDDGIHPNQAGYKFVTANVLKYLKPLLKEGEGKLGTASH